MSVYCFLTQADGRTAVADRCYALTPDVTVAPGAVFFRNSSRVEFTRDQLQIAGGTEGVCWGVGVSASHALADARFGTSEVRDLPLPALACWADADFDPCAKMIPLLQELGLQTVGEVLALPSSSVPLRFGKPAYLMLERLRHPSRFLWSFWPLYRPTSLPSEREVLDPEQRIQDLGPVQFVLKTLFDRLFLKLEGVQQSLAEVELRLSLENREVRILRARFPIAQTASPAVLSILRDRLNGEFERRPIHDYINEIEIIALELAHGRSSQIDAYDRSARTLEQWTSFLARTQDRLGHENVYQVELVERYLPEQSFKYVAPGTAQSHSSPRLPFPQRPMRLIHPPQALKRDGATLRNLVTHEQLRVVGWEGPEILSGEWWWENFERQYFRVQCHAYPDLWIYAEQDRDVQQGGAQLFLHGVFD